MKLNPDCIRDLMLFREENTYIRASKVGNSFGAVSLTAIETISKGIAAAVIEQSLSQSG